MNKIIELRAELDALEAEVRTLADAPESTPESDARFDELTELVPAKRAEIVKLENRERLVEAARIQGDKPELRGDFQIIKKSNDVIDTRSASGSEVRDAAMRAIEDADRRYLGSIDSNRAAAAEKSISRGSTRNYDADQVARMLVASSKPAYESAFIKGLTGRSDELSSEERAAVAEFRAMSTTGNAGGYGIPVLIDPTIVITTGVSRNPLIAAARVEAITTDAWKGVSAAQAAWSMDAEAAEVSDDSVTTAQPTINTEKPQAFIPYSIEIGMDYPGFATEMGRLLMSGYENLVAAQLAVGTGSTPQTTGLFVGSTTTVNVITDNTLAAADIDAIYAATPEDFRANGKWVMNVDVENEIRAFGSGTATSRFTVDQTAAGITLLNGKEVILTDHAPAWTGADGQNILVFGDMDHFLVAQRVGMTLKNVDVLFGANQRPTGQSGFYAYARFGSGVTAVNAFRRLKNITT